MTREEAIEYLNTLYMALAVFPNQQISLGNVDEMKESVSMAIQALEQEARWIPASERLPEERDWYLAVFKEKDTGYQLIPRVSEYIGENKWRIIDEEAFVKNYMDILKCVAWMPLPKPYEPQEGSEKE